MDTRRVVGFFATLVVVAVCALVLTFAFGWLFAVLPVPWPSSAPVGEGVGIAVALAVADSLAPWGRTIATELQSKPREELAVDVAVDALFAVASGGVVAMLTTSWVAIIGVSVLLGYGSFVYRNQAAYGNPSEE
ncbi:hypothetical protein [Halocalculus aciditolerans]|uniref:Uncharacterized protein n=1 Tax=Halocalculus aciditolerans TaxID=1383812 RepID=A0A830F8A7_9EURY|nr:hypothetical protein [Halocalculus aciditolerans]GGL49878.1 hypothetical protein GCM10009039_05010 [Halocalculus aciditolerans]